MPEFGQSDYNTCQCMNTHSLAPMMPHALFLQFVLTCFLVTASAVPAQEGRVIDGKHRHLGDSDIKDWQGVDPKPEGDRLKVEFQGAPNSRPWTLSARHRDVDGRWTIRLNDRVVGELRRHRTEKTFLYELAAGTLRAGTNTLEVVPDDKSDDIAIGPVKLHDRPLREVLDLRPVTVSVVDSSSGERLPARITIVRDDGSRPELYFADPARTAVREGLIYVNGEAGFELPRGTYSVSATRGMEWSRDQRIVRLDDAEATVELRLRREIKTAGHVAADTHIHTFTFSGHGDATAEERILSLAGEGVELAVATDHNHNLDYRPYQEALQLNEHFTPVVGNEVTSDNGHFNAFPLHPDDEVPPHKESDWVKLVEGMRLKGAKVVILNHPRWPDVAQSPFTKLGLNRGSGERAAGTPFTFDAMELVNSTVDTKDPLYLFTDWFALLNRGDNIRAVGSSDSHTVGDPAGQGRTYIKSGTDDPARLNVDELCGNIVAGRSTISLGIYSELVVNESFGPGDLVPVDEASVHLRLRVAAPHWIRPRRAIVFLNSVEVATMEVPASDGVATDATLEFQIKTDGIDAHLVCVVLGDPVTDPGWKTLNDYTLAATNPVFLDVNQDGTYRSPLESARRVYASLQGDFEALLLTLEVVPPFLGVQVLTLAYGDIPPARKPQLDAALARQAEKHTAYALFQRHRPTASAPAAVPHHGGPQP